MSRSNTRSRIRRASELIKQEETQWDVPLVQQIFHPFDADEILKLRIPHEPGEDTIAWHFEKSGVFSVRSAYRLGLNLKFRLTETGNSSRPDGQRTLWNLIWKAAVPPKVKSIYVETGD